MSFNEDAERDRELTRYLNKCEHEEIEEREREENEEGDSDADADDTECN